MVVPHASIPAARSPPVAVAALLVQLVPVPPVPASVDTSLTTTELGRTPVKVLLTRSLFTDKETRPFGVTRQEQQETSCSSGENAYTFTQMFPAAPPNPGPNREAPLAPLFVMLITESPLVRFAAYRI